VSYTKERERLKFAPRLNNLLYGMKYVVPTYRPAHYHSQDLANKKMAASALLVPCQIYYDDGESLESVEAESRLRALAKLKRQHEGKRNVIRPRTSSPFNGRPLGMPPFIARNGSRVNHCCTYNHLMCVHNGRSV
jgi:hypothetical protein